MLIRRDCRISKLRARDQQAGSILSWRGLFPAFSILELLGSWSIWCTCHKIPMKYKVDHMRWNRTRVPISLSSALPAYQAKPPWWYLNRNATRPLSNMYWNTYRQRPPFLSTKNGLSVCCSRTNFPGQKTTDFVFNKNGRIV
jgi:hypothetical protein